MDTLPNEVLLQVFFLLPHKYVIEVCSLVCKKWDQVISRYSFYSTLHFYSRMDMIKYLRHAKERRTINGDNNFFINCVKHIKYHYIPSQNNDKIGRLEAFTNLQSINGLSKNYLLATSPGYQRVYFQLHQPIHFTYCSHDKEWMSKFNTIKNNLKSLNVYMSYELKQYVLKQQEQELYDPIQLITIGNKIISKPDTPTITTPIKLLQLSTNTSLVNLTDLYIHFSCESHIEYIINEYTFEHIHQTCPSLESLTLEEFYMDIIDHDDNDNDEYDMAYNKKPYEPAYQLKTLNIIFSQYSDPCCFSYFGDKYPNINSLSFDLWYQDIDIDNVPIYKEAIINMLLQFPLLKRISFLPKTYKGKQNWLHLLFITWFNQHPNQLTHLDYIYDSISEKSWEEKVPTKHFLSLYDLIQTQPLFIQPEPILLSHLTSLSTTINNVISFASKYLLINRNTFIVSCVLENLTIKAENITKIECTYLYDWLDVFPNLVSLALRNFGSVKDNKETSNYIIINNNRINIYNEDDDDINQKVYKLHQLIKLRKKTNNDQHNEYKTSSYKLENLEIWKCTYWDHYGINNFFKECQHLKRLTINNTTLVDPLCSKDKEPPENSTSLAYLQMEDVTFDLSHLYLDFIYIKDLFYLPKRQDLMRCVHNIYVYSSAANGKRSRPILFSKHSSDVNFDLHIKCIHLNGIVINE